MRPIVEFLQEQGLSTEEVVKVGTSFHEPSSKTVFLHAASVLLSLSPHWSMTSVVGGLES
jgi:hypothetical protein